jgi:polar amino acid transport system substrate-binding protein
MLKRGTVLVAGLALVLAACGGSDESAAPAPAPAPETAADVDVCAVENLALYAPGVLTVATGSEVYPPWMLDNDPAGGLGFENGLVYALAAELGFVPDEVVWVGTEFFEAIAPGAKEYDFNIQQYSITAERAEVVTFSLPYYQPDKAVIALPTSPVVGATSFADLRTARWGATVGTTDLDYLENVIGIPAGDIAVFNDQATVFLALAAGEIDATVAALPTALFVTAVQAPETSIVALLTKDENDNGLGLLFAKDSPLAPCVDAALERLFAAGTVDALVRDYLLPSEDIAYILE